MPIDSFEVLVKQLEDGAAVVTPIQWIHQPRGLTHEQAVDIKRAVQQAYLRGVRAGISYCQSALVDDVALRQLESGMKGL